MYAQGARTLLGAGSGATGASLGGTINEGIDGFKDGWEDRVLQQGLGGALSGAAYSLGPNLAARNQAVKKEIALQAAVQKTVQTSTGPELGFTDNVAGRVFAHDKAAAFRAIAAPPGSRIEALIRQHIEDGTLSPQLMAHPAFHEALNSGTLNQRQVDLIRNQVHEQFTLVASVDALVRAGQQAVVSGDHPAAAAFREEIPHCIRTTQDAANALEFLGGLRPMELTRIGNLVQSKGLGSLDAATLFFEKAFDNAQPRDFKGLQRAIPDIPRYRDLRARVQAKLESGSVPPLAKSTGPNVTDSPVLAQEKVALLTRMAAPPGSKLEAILTQLVRNGTLSPSLVDYPAFKAAAKDAGLNQRQIYELQDQININYRNISSVAAMVKRGQEAVANGRNLVAADAQNDVINCIRTPNDAHKALEFLGGLKPLELGTTALMLRGKGLHAEANLFFEQALANCHNTPSDLQQLQLLIPKGREAAAYDAVRLKVDTALGGTVPKPVASRAGRKFAEPVAKPADQ